MGLLILVLRGQMTSSSDHKIGKILIENTLKIQAFNAELPGKLAKPAYIKFANLNDISMDDTERVNSIRRICC